MEQGCQGEIVYLEGGLYFDTLEALPLTTLEAIEVYRAPFLPAQLITRHRFPCDIIVLWLRRQPKRN